MSAYMSNFLGILGIYTHWRPRVCPKEARQNAPKYTIVERWKAIVDIRLRIRCRHFSIRRAMPGGLNKRKTTMTKDFVSANKKKEANVNNRKRKRIEEKVHVTVAVEEEEEDL